VRLKISALGPNGPGGLRPKRLHWINNRGLAVVVGVARIELAFDGSSLVGESNPPPCGAL